NGRGLLEKLLADPPEFVFNFAEGQGISRSRESRVPALLEMLGIPYTGSDPATLGVCLDKDWTRRMVETIGIHTPHALTVAFRRQVPADVTQMLTEALEESGLELPVIAKPVCEGSSKGIRGTSLIEKAADFAATVVEMWQAYHQPVLVEEFIAGDELTVGL